MINHAYWKNHSKSISLKIIFIISIILVLALLISTEKSTIVNINNVGLPTEAVDILKKLLGN